MSLPDLDSLLLWDIQCMDNVNNLKNCHKCGVSQFGLEDIGLRWYTKKQTTSCTILQHNPFLATFVASNVEGENIYNICHKCHGSSIHRERFQPTMTAQYATNIQRIRFAELHTLSFLDVHMDLVNESLGYIHGRWGHRSLVACPLLCMAQTAHTHDPVSPTLLPIITELVKSNVLYHTYLPLLAQPNVYSKIFLPQESWKHIVVSSRDRAPIPLHDPSNLYSVATFKSLRPQTLHNKDILVVGDLITFHNIRCPIQVDNHNVVQHVPWELAMFPYFFPACDGYYTSINKGPGKLTSFSDYVTHRALQAFSIFTMHPVYIMLTYQIQQSLLALKHAKKVRVLEKELQSFQTTHLEGSTQQALTSILHDAVPFHVPNSPQYFANKLKDLKASAEAKGMPHLFVTVTVDEHNMPEFRALQDFMTLYGKDWKDVPLEASRIWLARWKTLLHTHILGGDQILGEVDDYVLRYECQGRQSLHIHMCVWLKHEIDVYNIQRTITCHIPAPYCEESKTFIPPNKETHPVEHRLFNLVITKQQHSCHTQGGVAKPCVNNKTKMCNKNFPNMIHTSHEPTLHPTTARYIYYCPRHQDRMTVPYVPALLLYANAHVNVHLVRAEEWSFYMLKYSMKPSSSGSLHLSDTQANALGLGDLSPIEREAAMAILQTTPLSANEIALHITSTPVVHNSMEVIYIPCHCPQRRTSIHRLVGRMCVKINHEQIYCTRPSKRSAHAPFWNTDHMAFCEFYTRYEILSLGVMKTHTSFFSQSVYDMDDLSPHPVPALSPLSNRQDGYIGRDAWGNAIFTYNRRVVVRFSDMPPDKDIQQFAFRLLMERVPFRSELELYVDNNPSYVHTCVA